MAYLPSSAALVISAEFGVSADASAAYDSLATGDDRLLMVALAYENGEDPNISGITYNGVSLTKEETATVSPGDNFSETIEIWYLANPATGSNTLAMTNSSTSRDFLLMAAVYTGRNQSTPILSANNVTIARPLSDDGTTTIDKPSSDDDVFWSVVQDRGGDTAWSMETDNNSRLTQNFAGASTGLGMIMADRITGSGASTAVGATQTDTGPEGEQDLVGVFVVMQPAAADQTADIGLVTETTTISALTLDRALDVGLVTETDAVFAVEEGRALDVGQVTETDVVFAVEAPQTLDLGLVAETDAVFAMTVAGQPITANIGLVAETNAVFAVEAPQALDLGLVTEMNAVFPLSSGRILDVGQVTETDSVFAVSVDTVITAILGLVEESNKAFRFDSGLTPFWWAFYDQATPGAKAAKRRLRPLVFTDRVTGTNYIIRLNESTLLELQSHSPVEPFLDELFPAFQEPTMKVGKHIVRLFVSNGALGYEHYPFHVRKRPILFGRKIRPTAKNPTYILTLDESVLDEDT